jgi:tetratricopeptide (TPR) repeat protein
MTFQRIQRALPFISERATLRRSRSAIVSAACVDKRRGQNSIPFMRTRPTSSRLSERATRWLAGLGLALAIFGAYGNSLHAPFVYDDTLAIPENESIRRLWPLTNVLWPQAEGGLTVSGRPLLNLSFAINYAIGGAAVPGYHVFNILVHSAATLLLFGLARRTIEAAASSAALRDDRAPALGPNSLHVGFVVAALWGLHPLLTQAVTYSVQRAESLMGVFYLLSLYAFVRAATPVLGDPERRGHKRLWLGVSLVSCASGMATKEVMATAPLLVLLYDRTFVAGSFHAAWRARRSYYLGLGLTWLLLAALVVSTGGNRGGTVGIGTGVPWWAYPLTQFEALARYLALAAWPHPLTFEYGTRWVQNAAQVLPYAALVLPLLAATVVALRRWPALGFCGAWFFLILAPTSLAPGTIQMIVEHRMYLPLAGVVAVLVLSLHRCVGRPALILTALAAVALGLLTYRRNNDYQSHLALWSDTVAKRPDNPRAHDGLAEAYVELGRLDRALHHRREAVRLLPDESRYHYNLALTLSASGRRQEAVQHYQRSLQLAPDEPRTHNNLAILFGEMGNEAAALAHYAAAVRLRPRDPLYHYNHGVALMRSGRHADAALSFAAALRLRPDYADARFNLATAYVRLNRLHEALAEYAEALRLKPEDVDYRVTYGGALLLAKRPLDALTEFQRALTVRPNDVEAAFGVGNALAALDRTDVAMVQYQSVLRLDPNHASAHFKLGNLLLDLGRVTSAVEHYMAAIRLTPDDAEAHHNLGVAYARLERWDDAGREFEAALRLKPDYADARRNLQQLRSVLGR